MTILYQHYELTEEVLHLDALKCWKRDHAAKRMRGSIINFKQYF